jgi:hypothetical protein
MSGSFRMWLLDFMSRVGEPMRVEIDALLLGMHNYMLYAGIKGPICGYLTNVVWGTISVNLLQGYLCVGRGFVTNVHPHAVTLTRGLTSVSFV